MSQWKRTLATLAAAACLSLTAIAAAQDSALSTKVKLYLRDADLLQATRALSQQTGLRFVVEPTETPFGKINLSLEDVTAEMAIVYITQAAGGFAERDENGVFIIRRGERRAPIVPDVRNDVEDELMFQVIPVKRADPELVLHLLRGETPDNGDQVYRDMWERQRITAPLSLNGVGTGSPMLNRVSPDRMAAMARGQDPDGLLQLPGGANPQRAGGGGQPGGFGGGAGQPGGGGLGGVGGGAGQPGGGGGASFGAATGGQGLIPQGTTSLTYNPATNEILFRGTSQAYRELLNVISKLDKAPRQITVKVEFVTTTQALDRALGIDWTYERGGIFAGVRPGGFASANDPVFINYSTGNIATRLRTVMNDNSGRVVTAPVIRTLNNQIGTVAAFTNTWIFTTSQQVTPSGVFTQTDAVQVPVGTTLSVKPRINGDNTITMTLSPTVGNITSFRESPTGGQFPEFTQQIISVSLRVADGETIALGGLTTKLDTFQQSRIPLLSDLPIIGQLFRRSRTQQTSSELIIFVTPKIVDDTNFGLGIP